MEQVLQAAALCVTGALLAVVVRRGTPELAMVLALGTTIVVLLFLAGPVRELTALLAELGELGTISHPLLRPLYKTVGIALVVKVGGELCRDAGEAAPAAVLEIAGAVCALLAAAPLLRAVISLLLELME